MSVARFRNAVSPLRRSIVAAPAAVTSVDALIAADRPDVPVHCVRPAVLAATAQQFLGDFPGTVMYAVKCNPEPGVLRALWAGGVRHFDCASANEVAQLRSMFADAIIHFMHPIKARAAIRAAYFDAGVRDFVIDSADELAKIVAETNNASDLGIIVRLALPAGGAAIDLSGKFGADTETAAALLGAARPLVGRLGVSFHVGSQCLDPLAYRRAMQVAGAAIVASGVAVEIVDVGGGFPVSYPDVTPPPLGAFLAEIEASFEALGLPDTVELWAEPGRALVAAGGSVVVQVQARRGNALYLNDGVFGSLSDAGALGFRFPARLVRPEGDGSDVARPFSFFGPTCDSADAMAGPFWLPDDIAEGDWIELGQLGAYGFCLRTAFNGFDRARLVEVIDAPMLQTPGYVLDRAA